MAKMLYTNNAISTLSAGITNVATSLSVQTGDGAKFPNPSGTDYFWCTIDDSVNIEIVKVTARATDTFTIVRAQQGTGGVAFSSGAKVQLRWTATSSASVGGSTSNVQVNASDQLELANEIILDQIATPSTPAAGTIAVYAQHQAKQVIPKWKNQFGIVFGYQPGFFHHNIELVVPNTSTTVPIAFGNIVTARNSGTSAAQSTPTPASTSLLTSLNRINFGTGSTSTGTSGVSGGRATAWRGNASGLGGFRFHSRVALETVSGTYGFMTGLSPLAAAMTTEPSANLNSLLVGFDSTDTTWQFISSNGSSATKVNSGVTYVVGDVIDVTIFCGPNDTHVYVRAVRVNDGTILFDDIDVTATLPVSTTFMSPWCGIRSVTGTTAKLCALMGYYLEKFPSGVF